MNGYVFFTQRASANPIDLVNYSPDAVSQMPSIDSCLANPDVKAAGGTTGAKLLVRIDKRRGEVPCGIMKFTSQETSGSLARGIFPGEGPIRERLAYLVQQAIHDQIGLTFGVPPTFLLEVKDSKGDTALASFQFFVPNSVNLFQAGKSTLYEISQEEFQKFLFHIIMTEADAHEKNILVQKDKSGKPTTIRLIDLSNSLPRASMKGFQFTYFAWLMHPRAGHYLDNHWRTQLRRLDVEAIVDNVRSQWASDQSYFGKSMELPSETWDLLTLSLYTVKYGAEYNRSIANTASIFVPTPIKDHTGQTTYYGGDIEVLYDKYFDKTRKQWNLDPAIEELKLILSKQIPRRSGTTTEWVNINRIPIFPPEPR